MPRNLIALNPDKKQKRNRLIALCFASVFMLLVYGPLAQWFVAADRMLYDQLATHFPGDSLSNAFIISIDPSKSDSAEVINTYGRIIGVLRQNDVRRIILTQPPDLSDNGRVPGWAAAMSNGTRIYAPTHHRFADLATRDGFLEFSPDDDGVLRRAALWQLNGGVMSPSLPLAIAFDNEDSAASQRLSSAENAIYTSNYAELPRIGVDDLLNSSFDPAVLIGATVFVDTSPALVAAEALLPSGQFVTVSEITASLLAAVEHDRSITEIGRASCRERV